MKLHKFAAPLVHRLIAGAALTALSLAPTLSAAKDAAPAAKAAASAPAVAEPYIRADAKAFLKTFNAAAAGRPPFTAEVLTQVRKMPAVLASMDLPPGDLAVTKNFEMPGPGGTIALRLFDARAQREPGPVVVFYHGGGFILGSIDTHAGLAAEMARELDLPVVSVEYRLAPDHKWPAAPDDAEAAARWIAENGKALGRQFTGLVLSGDSAGGNLTLITSAALQAKPAALPVVMQIPMYPATDLVNHYRSQDLFSNGYGLDASTTALMRQHYAADPKSLRASPLLGDLANQPPTLLVTASLDPLRDQGRAYAAKLIDAGVPTAYYEGKGLVHGFATYRKAIPSAQKDTAAFLHLARTMLDEIGSK